jgi:luciferase family oxidoreductase group 1
MSIPLSVLDLVPVPRGVSAPQAFQRSVELARLAEELGYHRYWVAEHHNTQAFASMATSLLIAVLARETKRMRLGSGGVMLPNHSPLKIAEEFLTLEALYPGRIDLGLGRAPGTDQVTAFALRRSNELLAADDFPQQVEMLRAYAGESDFLEGHALGGVSARLPGVKLPPLWILGSSTYGAQYAAHTGRGYSFAYHFSPDYAAPALAAYREGFQPSAELQEPHAILGVTVLCSDSEERAEELARGHDLMWARIRSNERGYLPTAEEAVEHSFTPEEEVLARNSRRMLVWGTPERVRERLLELVEQLGVQELIVTSHIASHDERLKSYRLLAEAFA